MYGMKVYLRKNEGLLYDYNQSIIIDIIVIFKFYLIF